MRSWMTAFVVLALVPGLGGCFNGWFDSAVDKSGGSDGRFELVIEPDRTLVEGTHFLVDEATGDVWRLDVRDRRNGQWVRLAEGPTDVKALVEDGEDAPEDDGD